MSSIKPKQPPVPAPDGYERAILDGLSILLDYVAGCPPKPCTISRLLSIRGRVDHGKPATTMPASLVLSKLATIKGRLDNEPGAATRQAGGERSRGRQT